MIFLQPPLIPVHVEIKLPAAIAVAVILANNMLTIVISLRFINVPIRIDGSLYFIPQ